MSTGPTTGTGAATPPQPLPPTSPPPLTGKDDEYLYLLANRALGILSGIVILTLLTGFVVIAAHVGASIFDQQLKSETAKQLQELSLGLWGKLLPIAEQILKVVAPVLILLAALAAFRRLSTMTGGLVNFSRVTADLPSVLALLIITALCLLPFSGLPIPDVLNNVALVVVGFYFGKRKADEEKGREGS